MKRVVWPAYFAESLSSVGSTLLGVGIFFYTEHYFRWTAQQNFLLASGQGLCYVAGSLAADRLVSRHGRRPALIAIFLLATLVPLIALLSPRPGLLVPVLMVYTFVIALNWPVLESLVTSGADAHAMSKRVAVYNLTWSATNALTFAVCGTVIARWPAGMFILPSGAHLLSAAIIFCSRGVDPGDAVVAPSEHAAPEPELLAKRTLALWLARISLPATYVVVYGLSAMMPSLPVMQPLSTSMATLVASIWMIARWIAFVILGATVWWHTRPRILLVAAVLMLFAFIGVAMVPHLPAMIACQVLLGVTMGIIYAGSLYFGMVLSEGSTEHGGYHEALIGLGSVLGPGAAALAQWQWPGDLRAGVIAVSVVISATLLAAGVVSVRFGQKSR